MAKKKALEQLAELAQLDKKDEQQSMSTSEILAKAQALAKEKQYVVKFPEHIIPAKTKSVIDEFVKAYQLPYEYYAMSALTAVSALMGNRYKLILKRGWVVSPIMFVAIVGPSSSGKSPAMEKGMAPLQKIELAYKEEHDEQMEEWEQAAFQASITNQSTPKKPTRKEITLDDTTMEALNFTLASNPNGVIVYRDELMAWLNGMNQYRAGSDLEAWLSIWSNKNIKVNRVGKPPLFIRRAFVNVIGGMTPDGLSIITSGRNADNGFLQRILFVYPENMEKPEPTPAEPNEKSLELYDLIFKQISEFPKNIADGEEDESPYMIDMSADAHKLYFLEMTKITKEMNEADEDILKGILGKIESYILRFAIVLEILKFAESNISTTPYGDFQINEDIERKNLLSLRISDETMAEAIALTNYFKITAQKVLGSFQNPIEALPNMKRALYNALPGKFKTAELMEVGSKLGMSKSTIKRFVQDGKIFEKREWGIYEKRYL